MALPVEQMRPVTQHRPRIGPRLSHVNIHVWRLLVGVILVGLWWAVAVFAGQRFLPTPWETVKSGIEIIGNGTVPVATLDTLVVFISGYAIAAVLAIPLGLFMGGFRVLGAALEPYTDALSAMPRVAFIPVIIVFLGLGFAAKISIVFLGAVMPILINTYQGVLNCDGELIEMARSAGASDLQIFRKIMLPGALPYITSGLRIGASLALINTVVAELYTAVHGLGGLLSIYGNSFRMAPYFVVVFVLAVIGVIVMQSLKLLERNMERSRYKG
ncbi:MAG TPA: ABC transporter permease [Candidatus Binatia bacterium]|nr:ABC transporter permease [Candidatus Binatia bacterium]